MSATAARFRPLYSRHVLRCMRIGAQPLTLAQFVRTCALIELIYA